MPASRKQVRVTGVKELQAALREVATSSQDLTAAHKAVAGSLVSGIAARTPRRSGALAASWRPGATKTRAKLTSTKVYAGPIEYGWQARGIEPAAMVRETIAAEQGEILQRYEDELAKLGRGAGFDVK